MKYTPKAKTNNLIVQKMENETLVYDFSTNKAVCLNKTSAMIWELCNGYRTVAALSDEISKRHKTPIAEDLVWLALEQFNEDGLLENNRHFSNPFKGLSRREVIKSVGFASLFALPVVSSIVAPVPAAAQSVSCSSECVQAGDLYCNNCIGATANFVTYTSTDGSCTGPIISSSTDTCTSAAVGLNDIQVN